MSKKEDKFDIALDQLVKVPLLSEGSATGVEEFFRLVFGVTSETERLADVSRQMHGLLSAQTRNARKRALANTRLSLLALAGEQEIDLNAALSDAVQTIATRREMYRSCGNREKVAVFGGAFDCPTNGHVAAARAILDSDLGVDRVLFMPSGKYIGSKQLTAAEHRIAMCKLLEELDPRFTFFDFEIKENRKSETVRTLLDLSESGFAGTRRLYFVATTETATSLVGWNRHEELINAAPFIILPRPGYPPDLRKPYRWYLRPPHEYLDDAKGLIEVSSTQVRILY